MTKISSSDVRKVAQLARLELPEDQIETYTEQLEEILSVSYTHLTLPTILLV